MEEETLFDKAKKTIPLTVSLVKRMFNEIREKVSGEQEKIDEINVFPVPDRDTGTNLLITISKIIQAIEDKDYESANHLINELLDKKYILKSGRGNVGKIVSAWLIGVFLVLKDNISLDAELLTRALKEGERRAYKAIMNPKGGTILDVITASAKKMDSLSKEEKDLIKLLTEALKQAKEALAGTTEKMEILKKHNVVDAGALAFVLALEGILESLQGGTLKYPFDVQFCLEGPEEGVLEEIKIRLSEFGDSLDVVHFEDTASIHIHTDDPEKIREICQEYGEISDWTIENMQEQIQNRGG